MKYERITDREIAETLKSTIEKNWDSDSPEAQCYIRLAELENKIECGQLVELPYAPDRIEVGETRMLQSEFDDSVEFQTLIYIAIKKDNLEEARSMLEELEQNATQIPYNPGAIMFRLRTHYPDIIQHGDAFAVREKGWTLEGKDND